MMMTYSSPQVNVLVITQIVIVQNLCFVLCQSL